MYPITRTFPAGERYGRIPQRRRAAGAVPANVAEGLAKRGASANARYLNRARGSREEVPHHLMPIRDLGRADPSAWRACCAELARLLSGYTKAIASLGPQPG